MISFIKKYQLLFISFCGALFVALISTAFLVKDPSPQGIEETAYFYKRSDLSQMFADSFRAEKYLPTIEVSINKQTQQLAVDYSFDEELQQEAKRLLQIYKPDYSSIVVLDPSTGKILALANYERGSNKPENWALRASFPVASIFKVITATAAIDKYHLSPDQRIAFAGSNWTLYRKNVLREPAGRWARHMTIREAFARSINTVFAKIGINYMHPTDLKEYAARFKFNQPILSDMPIETGIAEIPEDESSEYAIGEVASGFTKVNLMSPLQGALIASAVAQDGVMKEPYIVETLKSADGETLYKAQERIGSVTMTPESARQLRDMMEETIYRGTSRKSFKEFMRNRHLDDVQVGGKTGSLTGSLPKGKCDWFVGFARRGNQKIAIATITVNKRFWTVRSSYLAQRMIQQYFDNHRKNHKISRL